MRVIIHPLTPNETRLLVARLLLEVLDEQLLAIGAPAPLTRGQLVPFLKRSLPVLSSVLAELGPAGERPTVDNFLAMTCSRRLPGAWGHNLVRDLCLVEGLAQGKCWATHSARRSKLKRPCKPTTGELQEIVSHWVRQYEARLIHSIRIGNIHVDDAESVIQNVWIKVWVHLAKGRELPEDEWPWLLKIAFRESVSYLRRQQRQKLRQEELWGAAHEKESGYESTEEDDGRDREPERTQAVRNALAQLAPEFSDVVKWRTFEGHSYAKIASTLDVSAKTVSRRHAKALRLLRRSLEEFPEWILPRYSPRH